ncbi:protein OSB2, chloroplastic-like isoform X2 [Humulus lupulus]|uniref:protein OSB2, chloroplastic-like isoform X2 n=1 Tax=Humulus lupulus TaxID=3486 RepID=UPI002B4024EC|nr:protein OSB2, chloroplastic-like isoform X2 [Humulus lupulus]
MAKVIEQAIASSTNNLVFVCRNPFMNTRVCTSRLGFQRRPFKCSVEYNNNNNSDGNYFQHYHQAAAFPRPAEIQWKKELCNTVQLIGIVGLPVEIKHLPSGKVVAWTRLAVKKSSTDTSWINLTFWDELANIASQHVEKGQQIYVSGRLISDTVESDDGKQQTYYKVVVQQLNFVEKNFSSGTSNDRVSDSTIPGKKFAANANSDETVEQLWQAYFANPVEWWDNRKNKRNPKYPDFKHKDTGEALWIEGRSNPPWVKGQLAILDSRMGSFNGQDSRMDANLVVGENFSLF